MGADERSVLRLWILKGEAVLRHREIDLSDFDVILVLDLNQRVYALMHPR